VQFQVLSLQIPLQRNLRQLLRLYPPFSRQVYQVTYQQRSQLQIHLDSQLHNLLAFLQANHLQHHHPSRLGSRRRFHHNNLRIFLQGNRPWYHHHSLYHNLQ
jgi:hypothetical protein